jgi:hypothetical protein
MSKDILRNVRLFAGGLDLTGASNKIELNGEYEEKDVTTWGSYDVTSGKIAKEVASGLFSSKISASGFWDAGDLTIVDDSTWANRGGQNEWTICPAGATEGNLAWLTNAVSTSYQLLGAVGDIAPWQASMTGTGTLARGVSLSAPGTARTVTGTGTIVQLPAAVPTGKRLCATVHVLSIAGTGTPTFTATVQSAAAIGFASPTTRLTFSAMTTIDGQFQATAGPITDQFYRLNFTISGTSPSFLIAAAVGID